MLLLEWACFLPLLPRFSLCHLSCPFHNSILVLRNVTCRPHPLIRGRKLLGANPGRAGGRRPVHGRPPRPEVLREQLYPRGVAPKHVPLPRGHGPAPGNQQRLPKLSFQGAPEDHRQAMRAGESEGRRGGAHAAAGRDGRRTHPRTDVVHRLGAAAPAAQTPHPQHRPAPGWSTSGMFPVLGRVGRSLPRARQQEVSRRRTPCLL